MAAAGRPPDPYAVLGIPTDATATQIRHAYGEQLRRNHPDTRSSDHADSSRGSASVHDMLRDIRGAYALLRDPVARARYDDAQPAAPPRRDRAVRGGGAPIPLRVGPVRWHPR